MARDDEPFLDRWSRRKQAARRGEPLPSDAPAAPQANVAAPTPAAGEREAPKEPPAELPSLDSLRGIASDYKDFMRPEVDAATRSAALKKLFFDPHFNKMDGLDVYIDDYSKLEALPSSTLRLLNQARHLGLFDDEKEKQPEPEAPQVASPEPSQPPLPESLAAQEPNPAPPPSVEESAKSGDA